MNPNKLLNELAVQAAAWGVLFADRQRKSPLHAVGESWERLTDEQRDVLRGLKSADIDVRADEVRKLI